MDSGQPEPERAGPDYPWPEPPPPGGWIEVAPGLRWLRMPLPFQLDHINLWLLAEGGNWAIVDCGYGDEITRSLWHGVLAEHRPSRVLVTHFHPDHIGNAGWLAEEYGLGVAMSEVEFLTAHMVRWSDPQRELAARREFWRRHGLDEERLAGLAGRTSSYSQAVPTLPGSYRRLREGDIVRTDTDWRVILVAGHAPQQALFHDAAAGILIAGDHILPRISPNVGVLPGEPEGDPLALFLAGLDRLATLPAETLVLPSHGLPFYGLRERAAQLKAHHAERLAAIEEACASTPLSAAAMLPLLFRRVLDSQQIGFAMAEAVAHANHLVAEGRVERLDEPSGIRFQRI